jgi:hypothetical protein
MGIDTSGWVEGWDSYNERWFPIVKIHELVGRRPEIRISLFGSYNFGVLNEDDEPPPVAAGRGLPPDASRDVVIDSEIEESHSSNFSHTRILWSEIAQTTWGQAEGERLWNGWQALFDIMARLAQDYGAEHVRLVAWFW